MAISRITAASIEDGAITAADLASASITGDKITANTIGSSNLTITGVSAGAYGNANSIVSLTIDAQGRISSASNVAITIPEAGFNPFLLSGM